MLGMPVWFWVLAVVLLLIGSAVAWVVRYYNAFRTRCRTVRSELTELLKEKRPEVAVVGERQGNLVVRMPDGEERVWDLVDTFVAVAWLPEMSRDPQARA